MVRSMKNNKTTYWKYLFERNKETIKTLSFVFFFVFGFTAFHYVYLSQVFTWNFSIFPGGISELMFLTALFLPSVILFSLMKLCYSYKEYRTKQYIKVSV